ncbi:DUF4179 domain-containing protein [Alicyclobacillus suci]|uniref:DUF4179 domain-containing protein n=1 Tax=Alicyclobacillus suci TaxID=2816080 RepID=UPI001A904631|nr:DUF4179 domain-containing protein [Alicyclobacillus suci]
MAKTLGDPGLSRTTVFDDKVHVSAIDHGITFTVNDIYDDQGRIALQYQINTSKGTLGKTAIAPEMKFYLKGKPLNLTTGGEAGGVSAQSWHGFNEIFPVSSNETLPKKFDLQIVIHQIGNTRGYWEVQIPVSGEKEFTKTRTISSSVSKTYEGTTLGIDDVTITPATVIVEYHYTFAQGQNTNIFLNASSNHAVLLPNLAGATYHSISDGIETVYAFAMFDRPDSLGDNMKILPENVPSSSSISTELKNLDISVPLN